jgi:hypothetical protein
MSAGGGIIKDASLGKPSGTDAESSRQSKLKLVAITVASQGGSP